jgi:hypothetical protein
MLMRTSRYAVAIAVVLAAITGSAHAQFRPVTDSVTAKLMRRLAVRGAGSAHLAPRTHAPGLCRS